MKKVNWTKLSFEFLSIFFAVVSAFALQSWNENYRDRLAANKILREISNGLEKDIEDVKSNMGGHKAGIEACKFWRKVVNNEQQNLEMIPQQYLNLTRDFIAIQNVSGYETLKSRGLELIENDSLRLRIISLYEYSFSMLKMLEEEYHEMQYQHNYFEAINRQVAVNFEYDARGNPIGLQMPLKITEDDRKILLSYLWKIQVNRDFILRSYQEIEDEMIQLRVDIDAALE